MEFLSVDEVMKAEDLQSLSWIFLFKTVLRICVLKDLFVASVACVSARFRRESWDESSFSAITRLETHATQTNSFVNQSFT